MSDRFEKLARLRAVFLGEPAARFDPYWDSDELLDLYDQYFAERIGWKCDNALQDALDRGLNMNSTALLDWGCGTGVLSRRFVRKFPTIRKIYLVDRAVRAARFAEKKLRAEGFTGEIVLEGPSPDASFFLAVSHVQNELDDHARAALIRLGERGDGVFAVEPGTPTGGASIVAFREALRPKLTPIAPCPHIDKCPMQAPHWCHFFAKAPPQAHTTAHWRHFSNELKIDLRSLPTSYVVMVRGEASPRSARMIGRPRMAKGYGKAFVCREGSVAEVQVLRKRAPEDFAALKEGGFAVYLTDGNQ